MEAMEVEKVLEKGTYPDTVFPTILLKSAKSCMQVQPVKKF